MAPGGPAYFRGLAVVWGVAAAGLCACAVGDLDYLRSGPPTGADSGALSASRPQAHFGDAGVPFRDAGPSAPGPDVDGGALDGGADAHSDADAGRPASFDAGSMPPLVLLSVSDFELGLGNWLPRETSKLELWGDAHSEMAALRSSERSLAWQGPTLDITELVEPGGSYAASAWVKPEGSPSLVILTVEQRCAGGVVQYLRLSSRVVPHKVWKQLDGSWFAPDCEIERSILYLEGPPAGVAFLVDDVSIERIDLPVDD